MSSGPIFWTLPKSVIFAHKLARKCRTATHRKHKNANSKWKALVCSAKRYLFWLPYMTDFNAHLTVNGFKINQTMCTINITFQRWKNGLFFLCPSAGPDLWWNNIHFWAELQKTGEETSRLPTELQTGKKSLLFILVTGSRNCFCFSDWI